MKPPFHPASKPVTVERVEKALDTMAKVIVAIGGDGGHYLPIYERLETELAAVKAREVMWERIRERARR